MTVITISSEVAAYGAEFAERVADRFFAEVLDREDLIERFIKPISTEHERHMLRVSPKYYLSESSAGISFRDYLYGAVNDLASRSNLVLLDCGGQFFLEGHESATHLRLVADREFRRQRFKQRNEKKVRENDGQDLSYRDIVVPAKSDFGQVFEQIERLERRFFTTIFMGQSESDAVYYDAIFNSGRLSFEAMLNLVDELVLERSIQQRLAQFDESSQHATVNPHYFELKNESERDFARLLDLYNLEWRYEPKTYPVEWDEEGRVSLAFSPDFYLPRFDLFLELTTMNQKYVSLKKKKAKRLAELYPGLRCRVVYKKDFQSLFERFEAAGITDQDFAAKFTASNQNGLSQLEAEDLLNTEDEKDE
ncbi:MAG: cytidylate kinase family protein [Eubacteriales bacterium]|nr:cytidylate kinase family protein [Eubacteriales bacterium]